MFRYLSCLALLISSSFAFAQNKADKTGLVPVKQTLSMGNEIATRAAGGALDQKDRKQLATQALEIYLRDLLDSGNNEKLNSWLKQLARNRFDAYVPSWSVKAGDNGDAAVNLVLAMPMFKKDLERSAFADLVTKFSATAATSESSVPAAFLLIDETTEDVFAYPLSPTLTLEKVFAGKLLKREPTERELNSVDSNGADRLGAYTWMMQQKLKDIKLEYDQNLAEAAIKFFKETREVKTAAYAKQQPWPPYTGISSSSLKGLNGMLVIFTIRGPEKATVLQKVDLIRLRGSAKHSRSFWSRNLNDPTQKEQPARIIEKVTGHFLKQAAISVAARDENKIHFIFDKKIKNKDVASVEGILRSVAFGADILLIPYEVNKDDVRYYSPVENGRAAKLVARINKEVNGVYARVVPGDNFIQIVPESGKEQ